MSRFVIPRRTVLRGMLAGGIAVAIPLPRLAGMLNDNGTAYASGEALPLRYGTWFFGNGINPPEWVPAKIRFGFLASNAINRTRRLGRLVSLLSSRRQTSPLSTDW